MHPDYPTLTLEKRTSAKQHIDCAIDVLFEHSSFFSAHTLAWAAIDVMRANARESSISTFFSMFEERIAPEHLKETRKILRQSYNYLKHSGKPETIDQLSGKLVVYTIFAACYDYLRVYERSTWRMSFFMSFFIHQNPQLVFDKFRTELLSKSTYFSDDTSFGRACEAYREVKSVEAELKANALRIGFDQFEDAL